MTVLDGLWGLEWAWHSAETNLRCRVGVALLKQTCAAQEAQESDSLALIVLEISAFIRILIKNIYTLRGRKRFFLPVTYFPTNELYPFTLRVTGLKTAETWDRRFN